jgi:hypothetical protein
MYKLPYILRTMPTVQIYNKLLRMLHFLLCPPLLHGEDILEPILCYTLMKVSAEMKISFLLSICVFGSTAGKFHSHYTWHWQIQLSKRFPFLKELILSYISFWWLCNRKLLHSCTQFNSVQHPLQLGIRYQQSYNSAKLNANICTENGDCIAAAIH